MKKYLLAAACVLVCAVTVLAEGKSLQHYPKTISESELKAQMKVLKRSLGVDCAHCHQMKPRRDFSVDTDTKKIARSMLDMQDKLNERVFTPKFLGTRRAPQATCYMCHKGEKKPEYEPKDPSDEARFKKMADSPRKKRVADAMKRLVDEINKTYFTWKDAPKATCWMCHRGRGEFKTGLPRASGDDETGDDDEGGDRGKHERRGGDDDDDGD